MLTKDRLKQITCLLIMSIKKQNGVLVKSYTLFIYPQNHLTNLLIYAILSVDRTYVLNMRKRME